MKMKSTPILFQSDMVVALRRNIDPKTQTRRIMGGCDCNPHAKPHMAGITPEGWQDARASEWWECTECGERFKCHYGKAGDELWVKETFSRDFANHYPNDRIWYRADDNREGDIEVRKGVRGIYSPESKVFVPFQWTPSIFCTGDASRINLHIERIRAERVSDISEADAKAEGCEPFHERRCYPGRQAASVKTYRSGYHKLWNSINAHPKPVIKRDSEGQKFTALYVAYPWHLDDMEKIRGVTDIRPATDRSHANALYRDKPLIIHPNPYVWAITFRIKKSS